MDLFNRVFAEAGRYIAIWLLASLCHHFGTIDAHDVADKWRAKRWMWVIGVIAVRLLPIGLGAALFCGNSLTRFISLWTTGAFAFLCGVTIQRPRP